MATILIPREPIPVALTAEQVVAYLLREGWTECGPVSDGSRDFRSDRFDVWIRMLRGKPNKGLIVAIARAESRPAEQVAADIAGPAVGVGGAGCEP